MDLCLISGRRPELLARTLDSFGANMFAHFELERAIVNLDPFAGSLDDHEECVLILRRVFGEKLTLFEPEQCGFGAAVRRVWSASTARHVFHLEDDWLLNETVLPETVFPLLTGKTKSLRLVSEHVGWKGTVLNYETKKLKIFGVKIMNRRRPIFGTSPAFFSGKFARKCSDLMLDELDPEKQMRRDFNVRLRRYMDKFQCRFLPGIADDILITDIGRDWRDRKNLEKVVCDGKSFWLEK